MKDHDIFKGPGLQVLEIIWYFKNNMIDHDIIKAPL